MRRWLGFVLGWTMVTGCGTESFGSDGSSGLTSTGEVPGPLDPRCGDEVVPTTFEIVNVGEQIVFVQVIGTPGHREVGLSRDGPLPAADCGFCTCSDCPGCAVCGYAPATIATIAPGQTHVAQWDGKQYPMRQTSSCGEPCMYDCPVSPGELEATVGWGRVFTAMFQPSLLLQGGGGGSDNVTFEHPATKPVRIEIAAELGPPAVAPTMSATTPAGPFESAAVMATTNPSDPSQGLEVAALADDGRYVSLFVPAEVGTHELMSGTNFRRAIVGTQNTFSSGVSSTNGTVTLDVVTPEAVEGSFTFELEDGTVTGTFAAPRTL